MFVPDDVADIDLDAPELETAREAWPWLVRAVIDVSLPLACILGVSRTSWLSDAELSVLVDEAVVESINISNAASALEWFYEALFDMVVDVEVRKIVFDDLEDEEKLAWGKAIEFEEAKERLRQAVLNHPVIQEAMELFDPEIVNLRVKLYDEVIKGL